MKKGVSGVQGMGARLWLEGGYRLGRGWEWEWGWEWVGDSSFDRGGYSMLIDEDVYTRVDRLALV